MEWVLWTSEPVETAEQVAQVVDGYRTRWLIEEYFKALKTGCAFEERQLRSIRTLTNALGLRHPLPTDCCCFGPVRAPGTANARFKSA